MRTVLKGKTQEFIQGGITPSGLATQVRRGIIKGFDASTYRATVQLLGSLSVWLEGVPVAKHIGSNLLSNGTRCGVLFFDESNPSDACVAFVYDGVPGAWITSGLVVDGTITAADCLSNVAGGVATIDASGDLNPPNHVRAAGRFYPGGQGARYIYDTGSAIGIGGGPFRVLWSAGSAQEVAKFQNNDHMWITINAAGASKDSTIRFQSNSLDKWDVGVWGSDGDKFVWYGYQAPGGSRMQLDPAGHLSNRGYIYPGTGSGLQSGAYIYGTAAPATLIGVSGADGFRATVIRAYAAESGGYYGAFQLEAPGVSEYWQVTYASDNKRLSFREGTGWPPTELMYLKTGGHLNTYGYLYPGTGSGFQTSRYIRDDGDRLLAYGGFKIDVSSGDTPLVFQRAGSYKWSNYVNATYDDLRWAAYIGGSWYDRMVLDDGSGSLYIDGTYNTFSPVPPKENMSPEDYLAWAMEDASKPLKPYPGIPKEPGELEKYRKDVSKIAIGVARYVDHLRTQVAALDTRLTQAGL